MPSLKREIRGGCVKEVRKRARRWENLQRTRGVARELEEEEEEEEEEFAVPPTKSLRDRQVTAHSSTTAKT